MPDEKKPGQVGWLDLTVPDAEAVRAFYEAVAGWTSFPISMGEYSDYAMIPAGAEDAVGGICHARGSNAGQPSGWMIYIVVENLEESLRVCQERGGKLRTGIRTAGGGRFCVIEDPAGAVAALYQP